MNRRNFFSTLAGLAGAAKLGPKKLHEGLFQISDASGGSQGISIKRPARFIDMPPFYEEAVNYDLRRRIDPRFRRIGDTLNIKRPARFIA